jgi:hypothetical protein
MDKIYEFNNFKLQQTYIYKLNSIFSLIYGRKMAHQIHSSRPSSLNDFAQDNIYEVCGDASATVEITVQGPAQVRFEFHEAGS